MNPLDVSKLRERLKEIVRPSSSDRGSADPASAGLSTADGSSRLTPDRREGAADSANLESALGGTWRDSHAGRCFVVERRVDAERLHGRAPVGSFASAITSALGAAPLLARVDARPPLVFFDLETTGLSGGAGTYAFLIGSGWFDATGGFVTRQYVLTRIADERAVLGSFGDTLADVGALVSFNGRTFDSPVLETRYLYHRLSFPASDVPHLDMLHPARRFWSSRADDGSGANGASCSLNALEQHVLGARRDGDVPGIEIPARYFQYLRSGDARPLAPVLEHNRLDLLSLAGVAARLLSLVDGGSCCARHGGEALALGRVYARAGLEERAEAAYRHALALAGQDLSCRWIRIDAIRGLALLARRQRRFSDAACWWQELLATRGCPPEIAREAREALAIHHEHRLRDFDNARAFALRLLDEPARPAWTDAVRHRLARIERKMGLF